MIVSKSYEQRAAERDAANFTWSKGERRTTKDNKRGVIAFCAADHNGKAYWNKGRISDRAAKRAHLAMKKAALRAKGK